MTSWSSIVKTATGTSGAMVLEMDENEVDVSVVVAGVAGVAGVAANTESDEIGIVR